jgi:DNA polymerase-1
MDNKKNKAKAKTKTKTKTKTKRLILLDSHAIIHRAYHALPDFSNSKGEATGALYGLSTMLFKIITELKPDYIVACFDLPKKTFRHEAYEDYKAGRVKADTALVEQLVKSRDLFKALAIPYYECEGFEADDLLGTIAEKAKKDKDLDIVIASGDMDTLQLVDKNKVTVYTLKKGINDTILYNEDEVVKRFSFEPEYLPDYKGLRGDPSDNIIGIKGIGEKTAITLISKFKTIENIYKNLKKNKNLFKDLGLTDRIIKLLEEGEDEAVFSKTIATIRKDAPIDFSLPDKTWVDGLDKDIALNFFRDMEFKSLYNRFLNIFEKENKTEKKDTKVLENLDNAFFKKAQVAFWLLNSEFTDPTMEEILSYKNAQDFDKSLALLEEDIKKNNLEYVYKNIEVPIIPVIEEMQKNGIKIDLQYLENLSKEYHTFLSEIEKKIWQRSGRKFNINSPKQLGEILFGDLALTQKGIKKSAGGSISTRESELGKLKELNPIISEILEYRELQKLLSTYIDSIPKLVSGDGRLHAVFSQTGTTTGRFSSSNPNLQNIPIKTELGKNIRNAFVADKGCYLASFDYSQIELRVAALLSQDKYFIQSFKDGKDIHTSVAMKVFNVGEGDVTKEMRRRAKIINFGILYGMGINALRENLGTDRKEAQIFYDNYFKQFPSIQGYLDNIENFVKKHKYTETLFGRKRYFKDVNSPMPFLRATALRMATNAPIQGTATADIIKIAMRKVKDAIDANGLSNDVKLIMQIHDELVFEIKEDSIKKAMKIIEDAMVNVIPEEFLRGKEDVPLAVSCSFGKSFGDLK